MAINHEKIIEYSAVLLGLACLCLPPVYLIFQGSVYLGHDSWLHIQWGSVFAEQLWSGDLYPRWLANMDAGVGSPAMFYYPPLAYFLSSPLAFIFPERELFYWRMNLSIIMLSVFSFLAARLFLKSLVRDQKSAIPSFAALLYVAQPCFYVADIFVRGAFAEAWVFLWVPILFFGINYLGRRQSLAVTCIVLGVFGVMTTHIVSAVFWLPISVIYLLVRKPELPNLALAFASVALGFGLSSGYLFTALAYLDHASVSAMYGLDKVYLNLILSSQALTQLLAGVLKFESVIFLYTGFSIVGVIAFVVFAHERRLEQWFWLTLPRLLHC